MIPGKKLVALYTRMLRFRMITECAARPSLDGEMLARHQSLLAGIAVDLARGDTVISSSEPLLPALLQESSIRTLVAGLPQNGNGRVHASKRSTALTRAQHDPSKRVEDFVRAAHDSARLQLVRSKRRIVMALCAAEDAGAGDWRYGLSVASREKLPVVFVRRTGAERSANHRDAKNGRAPKALAWGVPIIAVDAGDVVAVYRVASEAIARARHRRGPTVIDYIANPLPSPTGAEQNGHARMRDPILDLESYLEERRLNPTEVKNRVRRAFSREAREINEAFPPVRV